MSDIGRNKRTFFEYEILEKFECGIVLTGSEVKSLRRHAFSFSDSYVRIAQGQARLHNFHISEYPQANIQNHEALRQRELLLHHKEIRKLERATHEQGNTIVPLRVYTKDALIKFEIALCRGKKNYDKRQDIKKHESNRAMEQELKKQGR